MVATITPLEQVPDSELVARCLQATPGAFDELMTRHLKPVYSYIIHTVGDPLLAEDLTQETFLRVYRALGQFQQSRAFKPWLYTIASNVTKSALKKRGKGDLLLYDQEDSRDMFENQADPKTLEMPVSDDAEQALVFACLNQLNPSMRQAMLLRHVHELSYEEVAEAMGANVNTVRTWLKRGREALKVLIIDKGGLDHDATSRRCSL